MDSNQSCRREMDVSIPADAVEAEIEKKLTEISAKVKLPGFRPGKVPRALVKQRYSAAVVEDAIESLIPRYLSQRFEEEGLNVVGTPDVHGAKYEAGQPLTFHVHFEVAPEIELQDYRSITVHYAEPEVSPADVEKRLEEVRERRATFQNLDPRPAEAGDYAVVKLESIHGASAPVQSDETVILLGDAETMPEFTNHLTGMTPGETKEFDVTYPEDFGRESLAGKTVRFRAELTGLRRKELPELNDEFAQEVGDFRTLEELRAEIEKTILGEKQHAAQEEAKNELLEKLVDLHDFPVPEAYVERQLRNQLEERLRYIAGQGVDPRSLKLDWESYKEKNREKAIRDVKASLLLGKVAETENVYATEEEVDSTVRNYAAQQREPVAAVRMRLEKEGALGRIASRIRTDKTINLLFERVRKTAPDAPAEA